MQNESSNDINEKARKLRNAVEKSLNIKLNGICHDEDYSEVVGRCCENVIGYKKIPIGISSRAVLVNGRSFFIPVATTEGALVASMCRGIKLMNTCGGVEGYVENAGITRGFAMKFEDFKEAMRFYRWLKESKVIDMLKKAGNDGSRYLKVNRIESKHVIGNEVHVKVYGYTGDAMGMNMITKGCMQISREITKVFPNSKLVCISSNICTDKKWSAENYCNGRGRRVFMNVRVSQEHCMKILGVSTQQLFDVYRSKIVVGSTLVLGGYNCQAANYIAGMFLALGQDLGHVIESSNCILNMNLLDNECLDVSLLMPSVVVGVVGGGTHLGPTKSFLQQFSIEGDEHMISDEEDTSTAPGYLALAICAGVLAGELSLLGSLANDTLMKAHLELNRKK